MQKNKSWTAKVMQNGSYIYTVIFHPVADESSYFVVLVEREKNNDFLAAINGDSSFDLAEFGKIIVSGYGEVVKDKEKAWIEDYYKVEL
ncbi:MAG: hypothetical protein ABL857_00285 [Rickettsiales bacterium]